MIQTISFLLSFVHRAHAINNIIKTLTDKQTFEQFIGDIYSPAVIPSTSGANTQISTATGLPVPTLNLAAMSNSSTQTGVSNSVPNAKKDNAADISYNF